MSVHVLACVNVCVYVCMYCVCMHVSKWVYSCAHVRMCACVYMHDHVPIHVHKYTCTYVSVYVCTHVHVKRLVKIPLLPFLPSHLSVLRKRGSVPPNSPLPDSSRGVSFDMDVEVHKCVAAPNTEWSSVLVCYVCGSESYMQCVVCRCDVLEI